VLARVNHTQYANNATVWEVNPSAPVGSTANTQDLDPYIDDAGGAAGLKGQNAWAWSDTTDDCFVSTLTSVSAGCAGPGGGEDVTPTGGNFNFALQTFTPTDTLPSPCPSTPGNGCTWNPADGASWPMNRQQNATQAFYFVNKFHDHLAAAPIGFTTASRNFEGADRVLVNSDDGAVSPAPGVGAGSNHINNANFSTPRDGTTPVMQMYLFRSPIGNPSASKTFRAVNGGDDAIIVYHEYTHGLSNRLVGDGSGLDNFQPGAMGEAWSDWYANDFVVDEFPSMDTSADGELSGDAYVTDSGKHLIRTEAIDCPVGSTSPNCPGTATAGSGGYTLGDMGKIINGREVHADGEIWGQTLWDIRTALGSAKTERLVTDALRNSPEEPSFLDQRDQILAADVNAFGGADVNTLWSLFAARGMGASAISTNSDGIGVTEAFDTPAVVQANGVTVDDSAPGGDGDGRAEPGETVKLTTSLKNPGPGTVTNLSGTLTAGALSLGTTASSFTPGTVASTAAATNSTPYTATLPAATTCGGVVPLSVASTSDQGGATSAFNLVTGGLGTPVDSVKDNGSPGQTITDNSPAGVDSAITLTDPGRVADVNVKIDSITHTFISDLGVSLISPSGRVVKLVDTPGDDNNGGDNFTNTVLDDSASGGIIGVRPFQSPNVAPYTGTFKPLEPLARFNGEAIAGDWKLHIVDHVSGDTGHLVKWTLTVTPASCNALPSATTGAADAITTTGATLHGGLDTKGIATQARYEFGTTTAYGSTTNAADSTDQAVSGLAPSTTYHYRLLALRGGLVAATGADQTFTTAANPPPPPSTPGFSFKKSPKTLTLDSKGQFTYTFTALAGLKGTALFQSASKIALRVEVTTAAKKKKIIKVGSKSFTVTSKGAGKVKVKVSKSLLKYIKKHKSLKVTVTLSSKSPKGSAKGKLTLKAPKKKKK
jgi:subtilisin-like proprotein convertase family protein